MVDQTGMTTTWASPTQSQREVNAFAGASEQSLYAAEELLHVATMALLQAVQAVSKARAQGARQESSQEAATTQARAHALQFTQRLTHSSGQISSYAEALTSMCPPIRVTDAGSSSQQRESAASFPREKSALFREEAFRLPLVGPDDPEPPVNSVVIDYMGDVWQRTSEGWSCCRGGATYRNWGWKRLVQGYEVRLLIDASEE